MQIYLVYFSFKGWVDSLNGATGMISAVSVFHYLVVFISKGALQDSAFMIRIEEDEEQMFLFDCVVNDLLF